MGIEPANEAAGNALRTRRLLQRIGVVGLAVGGVALSSGTVALVVTEGGGPGLSLRTRF